MQMELFYLGESYKYISPCVWYTKNTKEANSLLQTENEMDKND